MCIIAHNFEFEYCSQYLYNITLFNKENTVNKNIKELAEQAMDDLTGCWLIPDQFCEEFAELIVKACINKQLELAADLEVCPEGYEPVCPEFVEGTVYGLKEGAELIGQHFGVKE